METRQKLLDSLAEVSIKGEVRFNGVEEGRVEAVLTQAKEDKPAVTGRRRKNRDSLCMLTLENERSSVNLLCKSSYARKGLLVITLSCGKLASKCLFVKAVVVKNLLAKVFAIESSMNFIF